MDSHQEAQSTPVRESLELWGPLFEYVLEDDGQPPKTVPPNPNELKVLITKNGFKRVY